MEVLNKTKIELLCDAAISLLGIKTSFKDMHTPVFTKALFTIGKTQRQPSLPTDKWIKKTLHL